MACRELQLGSMDLSIYSTLEPSPMCQQMSSIISSLTLIMLRQVLDASEGHLAFDIDFPPLFLLSKLFAHGFFASLISLKISLDIRSLLWLIADLIPRLPSDLGRQDFFQLIRCTLFFFFFFPSLLLPQKKLEFRESSFLQMDAGRAKVDMMCVGIADVADVMSIDLSAGERVLAFHPSSLAGTSDNFTEVSSTAP